MKKFKVINIVVLLIVCAFIFTSQVNSDELNSYRMVKNGKLMLDETMTIQNALEGFSYWSNFKWVIKKDRGRDIVSFISVFNLDAFTQYKLFNKTKLELFKENKDNKNIYYIINFAVAEDGSSFKLDSSSIVGPYLDLILNDEGTISKINVIPNYYYDDNRNTVLRMIYANSIHDSLLGDLMNIMISDKYVNDLREKCKIK